MKLLVVFALCGVTCCLAGPTCSKDELAKCSEVTAPTPLGTEEEELEKYCKMTKCFVEIYERCGTEVFAIGPFPVKGYRRVVNALCDKSNPLREKYLDNAKCIRSATEYEKMEKMLKRCDIVDRPKEEFCRKIPDGFKCAVDYITGKCGKDAGEVVQVAGLPYLDPYDCLSS